MDKIILLTIILAVIIIVTAFLASRQPVAEYSPSATTLVKQEHEQFENYVVNDFRSVLYNTNGLYNFYSSGEVYSLFYQNRENFSEFVAYILYFLPSFIDDYCKSFDKMKLDQVRCNNMYIDNVAEPDSQFSSISQKELQCQSVLASSSTNGKNNVLRVFNNTYHFLKRCLKFKSIKFTTITTQINGKTKEAFKVVVTGDITAFVLSRPLFISYGSYGLYRVIHNTPGCVFSSYSNLESSETEKFFIVVSVDKYKDTMMYPNINQSLAHLSENTSMPITIYYLSYKAQIIPTEVKATKYNVLTLLLSSNFLKNSVSQSSNVVSYTIPTTLDKAADGIVTSSNISINFDKSTTIPNEIFNVIVSYGPSYTNIPIRIPRLFLNEISYCRNNDVDHTYHICLTYTTDMMIVTCFLKYNDDSLKEDAVFVSRQSVSYGADFVTCVYTDKDIQNVLASIQGDLAKEMNKYKDFTTTNSIPNSAYMAKYLGYSI